MKCQIREIHPCEYTVLEDFLYYAIFQKEGEALLPKEIIYTDAHLKIYYQDFGKAGDYAIVAEDKGHIVGAAWSRILNATPKGFGNLDTTTPELAISIKPEYRNKGIGKELLIALLSFLKSKGYTKMSLAVQKDNYATALYQKVGFQIIKEIEQEYIMVYHF